MNKLWIYLFLYKNGSFVAEAFPEEYNSELFSPRFLFQCPEQWLPDTREKFLAACTYYKVQVPENVIWVGYVPF